MIFNYMDIKKEWYNKNKGIIYLIFLSTFLSGFYNYHNAQPLVEGKDKFLGNAIDNTFHSNYLNYWNQVTAGNAGKWGSVEYSQNSYNWTTLDKIYNYAKDNNLIYKHHTLVWGSQQPNWITTLSVEDQLAEVEEWMKLVGERYPDMDYVDVVNEPLHAPAEYAEALGGDGDTGWDWIIKSFELARQYMDPSVKLILNEYNVLGSTTNTNIYLGIINLLMERNLIDGIGVQGHYFEFKSSQGSSNTYSYAISTVKSNLKKLTDTGLPFYITEFDINEADDEVQLKNYKTYFPIFWENPNVKGITFWGYVEYDMWKGNAFLVDERHKERPAMEWLKTYVNSPFAPVLLSPLAFAKVPRNPLLNWHMSETATSYNLQISSGVSFTSNIIDTMIVDTTFQLNTLLTPSRRYYWRVSSSNDDGTGTFSEAGSFNTTDEITDIEDNESIVNNFVLHQNYPNPFNPTTQINYSIPAFTNVKLEVFDVLGRKINVLVNKEQVAGNYSVTFNANSLSSGIYLYKITTTNFTDVKQMTILR